MMERLTNKLFGAWESLKLMRLEDDLAKLQESIELALIRRKHLIKRIEKCREMFGEEIEGDDSCENNKDMITEMSGD